MISTSSVSLLLTFVSWTKCSAVAPSKHFELYLFYLLIYTYASQTCYCTLVSHSTGLVGCLYSTQNYFFSLPCKVIINAPVSLIVLPGVDAHFYCSGIGEIVIWEVDKLPLNNAEIKGRGIKAVTNTSSGIVQSNLTVPATSVNNGTTVRCGIRTSLTSIPVISNYSMLIVLSGTV